MANNKVTIQDIADALGLSRNTVSKAMNNTGSISESTKNKIIKKAADMGYKQFGLISLANQATSSALATPTLSKPIFKEIALFTHSLLGSSHFGSKLLDYFQKTIGDYGYTLSVYMIRDYELNQMSFPSNFNIEHTAGILCLEIFHKEYSQFLCNANIPILFVDTVVNHCSLNLQADLLYMENETSTYLMLKSLINDGFKKISFIGDRYHCQSFFERWKAYARIMEESHLTQNFENCILAPDSESYQDTEWMASQIRQLPSVPHAIFCANDSIGISVIKALKSLNYSVPKDIKVCGFDNAPESTIIVPSLTTVRIPSFSMGYVAAEMLLSRINHPELPYRTTYIKTEVIFRESTKK